jgi:hypothetical protein
MQEQAKYKEKDHIVPGKFSFLAWPLLPLLAPLFIL